MMGLAGINPIYWDDTPKRKRRKQCKKCKFSSSDVTICNQRVYTELIGYTERKCKYFKEK